eukprot:gnl/MRDRNA2_/MRDRNA2_139829_c0_seq1.p2 gnl/MRDRNA2_/MRDRNA2_139829_c0~~gnl/MRDRNA2_/MRDRNA2_139829_c0_seq1.p2  ORF type:complete len:150 (+),score=39.18 gnl/MRDRNA2_/MRDRNA2_139829_c0_seq1:78-527(+)
MATCFRLALRASQRACAPRVLTPMVSQQFFPAFQNRSRWLSTSSASCEDRVIRAVKKYLDMRREEGARDIEAMSPDDPNRAKSTSMMEQLGKEVTAGASWDDFGLDEIDKVEVLLEVEEEFGTTIPDEVADRLSSLKETVEYFEKEHKA